MRREDNEDEAYASGDDISSDGLWQCYWQATGSAMLLRTFDIRQASMI